MKIINIINAVVSIITAVGWIFAITLSVIGTEVIVTLSGLMMFALWSCNSIGFIIGLISVIKENKSILAWASMASHAGQVFSTILLICIGILAG
jgi:hypothetical protein